MIIGKRKNYLLLLMAFIALAVMVNSIAVWRSIGSRAALNVGIIVNGEGTVVVKPDIAYVSLGVETGAGTAEAVQQGNARLMARIITELKKLGVAEDDIQTADFNLVPNRLNIPGTDQDKITGYLATNQITVTVRNLNTLGVTIDRAIKAGANNINNISFSVASPDKWRTAAITKAINDAQSKAEAIAKASGAKIKKVGSITESASEVQPFLLNTIQKEQSGLSMDGTPLERGTVKITANLKMSFRI